MTKQVIVIRHDLKMRLGKAIAQGSHASMAFLTSDLSRELTETELEWVNDSFTKICVRVDSESELLDIVKQAEYTDIRVHLIKDNGKTEFGGVATYTCCAIGPDESSKIDKITGHLKLL